MAAKRADRKASDGVVELYSHGDGRVGVMVEINSETDFVSRSEEFRIFAHEIALQIAASSPNTSPKLTSRRTCSNTRPRSPCQSARDGKPEASFLASLKATSRIQR